MSQKLSSRGIETKILLLRSICLPRSIFYSKESWSMKVDRSLITAIVMVSHHRCLIRVWTGGVGTHVWTATAVITASVTRVSSVLVCLVGGSVGRRSVCWHASISHSCVTSICTSVTVCIGGRKRYGNWLDSRRQKAGGDDKDTWDDDSWLECLRGRRMQIKESVKWKIKRN